MDETQDSTPHVVILGGGFGGLDAARTLAGAPVRVTLIDRHNYHLFQPLLYQVATAALSPGDVASPIRWILRRQANINVLLANVRGIDVASKTVLLEPPPALTGSAAEIATSLEAARDGVSVSRTQGSDPVPRQGSGRPEPESKAGVRPQPQHAGSATSDTISYDYLIVTTGAAHAYFGHPEWAGRAPGLKTLDDALEIRRRVLLAFEAAERETNESARRRLLTFVIVGGGPTGVELAGALAEIARQTLRQDFRSIHPESSRIVLIEGGPNLLATFPASLRDAARASLQRLGVEVRTGSVVTAIDAEGVMIGAERIAAQTVLWAAGVAASPIARSLGLPLDRAGRVPAEPTLAVPGHPQIFVAGDICALQQDGAWLPGVAQVAKQGGAHAARNVLRAIRREPLQPFRYRDYGNMAVIGRGSAVADIGPMKLSGLLAWLIWIFIHIFWLIGFRNRVAVMSEWAWFYFTMQRRVRLITGGQTWPA